MSYRTIIPSEKLKPFIKAFAITENALAGSYKVLPGTSIVMGFQYSGSLSFKSSGEDIPLTQAGITGLNDTFREFNNVADTKSILVMFSETGASAFLKQPANELFRQSLSLDDIVLKSKMDAVLEQITAAKSDFERINLIEHFFISTINPESRDELIEAAVQIILNNKGNVKIAQLAQHLFISQSRFEKRFRKIVGTSAKKFAGIVRLRNMLETPMKEESLTRLGLSAGYFDQAHFIKDFRSMTGQTPEQYFKS